MGDTKLIDLKPLHLINFYENLQIVVKSITNNRMHQKAKPLKAHASRDFNGARK
jgi:hypothetical protein